jgi:hypothetical protein
LRHDLPGCAGVPSAWGRGRAARLGARAFRPPGGVGVPSAWVRGRSVRLGARASRPPGGAGVPSAWGRGRPVRLCTGGASSLACAPEARVPRADAAGVAPAWVRGHLACLGARASRPPPKETGVALFDAPEGRGSAGRRFNAGHSTLPTRISPLLPMEHQCAVRWR